MRPSLAGAALAVILLIALVVAYSTFFTVYQTKQALVIRLGEPVRVITEPGLNAKIPFIDSVIYIDKRILNIETPAQEVIASSQDKSNATVAQAGERLVVDAFARYRITDPLKFLSDSRTGRRQLAAFDPAELGFAPRARRRDAGGRGAQPPPGPHGADARAARSRRAAVRHPGGRRSHPPGRSAGAKQPGGLSAHANRAAA